MSLVNQFTNPVIDTSDVKVLMEMGLTEKVAKRCLKRSGNVGTEAAVNWYFNNPGKAEIESDSGEGSFSFSTSRSDRLEHKLVLCVRKDLEMGVGKVAAQCSHATLGIYQKILVNFPYILSGWEQSGQKKVVLSLDNEEVLNQLANEAGLRGLPCHVVRDAGRTEVEPGTLTVLAIAGLSTQVDEVTGHLSLLK
eukprot:TRINITY_DN16351_c0_g1_i1.p1 TRINITY_DN16351_c0_g1~~TRINITY_DN16351_c0_g1_i1.p1  ORF type:complete len:194 (+),score=31.21 TRINITY_DN16351_c0_g1_i1:51-632(+)